MALAVLCALVVGSAVTAQTNSGKFGKRTSDWTNSGGPWFRLVCGFRNDPGCSCYLDPHKIDAPGYSDLIVADTINWDDAVSGKAGLNLDYLQIDTVEIPGIPFPLPLKVHGDEFVGDMTNYLEEWSNGQCHGPTPCTQVKSCSYKVSFTLDATQGSVDDPITWTTTSTGGQVEEKELNRTDPNKRAVNLSMTCQPGCGKRSSAKMTWDGGCAQPTRNFMSLDISCTKC